VPYLGTAVLRSPTPRRAYRGLLAAGLGGDAAANASDELLRLSVRRGENARTVASLMHAINRFRRARPETVLADDELRRIAAPTLFCLGTGDPFLAPAQARPWVEKLPAGTLVEVRAGHAPWLDDPVACGATVREHLAETVVGPAA
jgi:pimeloyl-ACP methyl ester carboxylesterase